MNNSILSLIYGFIMFVGIAMSTESSKWYWIAMIIVGAIGLVYYFKQFMNEVNDREN